MKQLRAKTWTKVQKTFGFIALCLVIAWNIGCQSIIQKNRNKDLMAREKFSCGESMPPRIP